MYIMTSYFKSVFTERTGLKLTEDNIAYIKSVCDNTEPYHIIDNKGRDTNYFTFRLEEKLITLVCDAKTKKIITVVLETHNRPQFRNV